ncbi:MAG TPA: TIR domain-containing protein [Sphingomicrobium sp.]|nr:TIR domain-containing protein [Sphingomicrobium sp.]
MSRVFLSYSREDVDAAKALAEAIANAGHDVWWDRHLHGGSRFATEIDRALKAAEAVVVLWSEASVDSAWVQDEAAEGRDSGRLVPIALGSAKPPLGFRQFHTIDLAWDASGAPENVDPLLDAIARTCGPQTAQQKSAAPDTAKKAKASICVLPFANMSGEPEQEYFSDGISEDIITDLSKVSALSVVARNTAFMFKGQTVDVKEVAKTLGVSHVLEGSVRKAGNRVRITAQLIDGTAGDHVWADRYDRDLTDIFEIQDEISKAIVEALRLKLLPKEKSAIESRGTSSVEAYNLYLMARQHWITGAFADLRRDEAIERLCRQAIALDPEYAQAWALMALAQLELRFVDGKDVDALPAAERALAINPNLPEAHCTKARYLEEEGRTEEAEKQIRTALQLDPDSWEVNREAARMHFRNGHIREAIPFFEKTASLMDMDFNNPAMLITCYNSTGDHNLAKKAAKTTLERAEKTLAKDPTNCSALAMGASALTVFGEEERARDWVRRALLLDPDNLMVRYNLACSLALELDDPEGAIEAIRPFFEKTTSTTVLRHLDVDPDLDPIRDDPRFKAMVATARARLGLDEAPPGLEIPAQQTPSPA